MTAPTPPWPMFRPVDLGVVGQWWHRSGWPYAMGALRPWSAPDAPVILDDFVERTFLFGDAKEIAHTSPWIGVFHHPVTTPDFFGKGLAELDHEPAWRRSRPHLKLAVALSDHLAEWIRAAWDVPCLALRLPSQVPELTWSPERFAANPARRLVQVGSFLRNLRAIHQLAAPAWLRKTRLFQDADWVRKAEQGCLQAYAYRPEIGEVEEITRVDAEAFDRLLAENLMFLELIDASANNTVVECIARNTPIVLNRLPGPEFYLGRDYPLFYDDITEVEALLSPERILAAHQHLQGLPKRWLKRRVFAQMLADGCRAEVPELWADGAG